MKKIVACELIIVLAAFIFSGCENKGDPPSLPPAESMIIDFSFFTATKKSSPVLNDLKGLNAAENTNWTVAATVAGVWNTILVANLAIPVAAFEHAVENKPSYIDNKTWQWKYSVNVLAASYTARLTGQIKTDSIKWEMYIKKDGVGGFDEFKWFEGTTALDGNGGRWTLIQSQSVQIPMLKIEWEKSGSKVGNVKYTYIKTGEAFYGSYIEYGKTSASLDAFYNVSFWETNRAKFVIVQIQWSTSQYNGQVKAIDYFQDNNWHCWDSNGNDGPCVVK